MERAIAFYETGIRQIGISWTAMFNFAYSRCIYAVSMFRLFIEQSSNIDGLPLNFRLWDLDSIPAFQQQTAGLAAGFWSSIAKRINEVRTQISY